MQFKLKELMESKWAKYGLLMFLIFLAGLIIFFNQSSDPKAIYQAEKAVQSLYQDKDQIYLNPNVNKEQLEEVNGMLNKIKGKEVKVLRQASQKAEKKYDAVIDLANIYQVDKPLTLKTKEDLSKLLLQDGVDSQKIMTLRKKHTFEESDDYTEFILFCYQEATHILGKIEEAQYLKETLPTVEDIKVRGDIPKAVKHFVAVEDEVSPIINHPQMKKFKKELEDSRFIVQQAIDFGGQFGMFDEETSKRIGDSVYLEDYSQSPVTAIDPTKPLKIALTFDDGPNEEYTTQVLDILKEYDIPGTFFVMGAYVDECPQVAKRIVKEGHVLGNHTYTHPNFDECKDEEILQEINWTNESIYDETGQVPTLYRLPFGAGGARAVRLLPDMTSILWNADSLDWKLQDAKKIHEQVMDVLQQETLLLMHDTSQYSVDALKLIIPDLIEKGYEFVTVEEMDFEMRYFE